MARRRVFRTKIECPSTDIDLTRTSNRSALLGRMLTFERVDSKVSVCMDGVVLGHLDSIVGPQVAAAINQGQSFEATIEKCYPTYDMAFNPTGGQFFLKVQYFLDAGNPGIEIPQTLVQNVKPASRSFYTKVAGVTYERRQETIARCLVGERLMLIREPDNPISFGAIKVMRLSGEHIGYIPEHVAREGDKSGLAYQLDRGDKYQCRIKELTGGGTGQSRGVNIEIVEGDDFDSALPAAAQAGPSDTGYEWLFLVGITAAIVVIAAIIAGR